MKTRVHYRVTHLAVAHGVVVLDGSARLGGPLGRVSFELRLRPNRTATLALLDARGKTTILLPRASDFVYAAGDP